jgi:hypothetical protein
MMRGRFCADVGLVVTKTYGLCCSWVSMAYALVNSVARGAYGPRAVLMIIDQALINQYVHRTHEFHVKSPDHFMELN